MISSSLPLHISVEVILGDQACLEAIDLTKYLGKGSLLTFILQVFFACTTTARHLAVKIVKEKQALGHDAEICSIEHPGSMRVVLAPDFIYTFPSAPIAIHR